MKEMTVEIEGGELKSVTVEVGEVVTSRRRIWELTEEDLRTAPRCKVCHHEPCPFCEKGCDTLYRILVCPNCGESLGDTAFPQCEGSELSCTKCRHRWAISGETTDCWDYEYCCEGECDWDRDEEYVQQWCKHVIDNSWREVED